MKSILSYYEECVIIPENERQTCGSVALNDETECLKNEFCCYDPFVMPHCYIRVSSPIMRIVHIAAKREELRSYLKIQMRETFKILNRSTYPSIDPITNHVKLNALLEAVEIETKYSMDLKYPNCPLNVPMCARVKCGPKGSNNDPNICYTDPRCCYDPSIAMYRDLYGEGFLGGTPVCYYGPTSKKYMELANRVKPWNAFFMKSVVEIFNLVLSPTNLEGICLITTALADSPWRSPVCGWKDINEQECKLKDCCWNSIIKQCRYPDNRVFKGSLDNLDVYPELKADDINESICSPIINRYPESAYILNTYKRLPCDRLNLAYRIFGISRHYQCPIYSCCKDISFEADMIEFLHVQNKNFSLNLPDFKSISSGGINSAAYSLQQKTGFFQRGKFCPYYFKQNDYLPDLTDKLSGCCEFHSCYIIKKIKKETLKPDLLMTLIMKQKEADLNKISKNEELPMFSMEDLENIAETSFENYENFDYDIRENTSWGQWSDWSTCSHTCGKGLRTKQRYCLGELTEWTLSSESCGDEHSLVKEQCFLKECSHHSWTTWSQWSRCQASITNSTQKRFRKCQTVDGLDIQPMKCSGGNSKEFKKCEEFSCITWTSWSELEKCNASCYQAGTQKRIRKCISEFHSNQIFFSNAVEETKCLKKEKDCSDAT